MASQSDGRTDRGTFGVYGPSRGEKGLREATRGYCVGTPSDTLPPKELIGIKRNYSSRHSTV